MGAFLKSKVCDPRDFPGALSPDLHFAFTPFTVATTATRERTFSLLISIDKHLGVLS